MEKLSDTQNSCLSDSTESSNRMEEICTSDERLRKLVMDKTKPQSRDEREIEIYKGEKYDTCKQTKLN